jgi:hypothetical protein
MANDLDDLFGGSSAPPPPPVRDGLARSRWMAFGALVLNLAGACCFTSVPGTALALWAWYLADEAVERVESGALPSGRGPAAARTRDWAFRGVMLGGLLLVLQIALFSFGFYEAYGNQLLGVLGEVLFALDLGVLPGLPPPGATPTP